MKRALFLGRFQPLHKGHVAVMKRILGDYDELVVVIGSSQYSNKKHNPFSADEREEMVKAVLSKDDLKRTNIFKIDDIHDNDMYVKHVEKFIQKTSTLICGSPLSKELFRRENYEIIDLDRIDDISATEVRKGIVDSRDWKSLVPKEVVLIIKNINGVQRLKTLYQK